jgi:hypothetical protein
MFREERRRVLEPKLISWEVNMTGVPLWTMGARKIEQDNKWNYKLSIDRDELSIWINSGNRINRKKSC